MTVPPGQRRVLRAATVTILPAVAVGLAFGLATGTSAPAEAQMVPATLLTVAADTPAPAEPTTAPPTSGPADTPRSSGGDAGGDGEREDDESGAAVAPTVATDPGLAGGPTPTRTRRPTRTPRTTATTTPTPMVAGGLRLRVASDPPLLVAGSRVTLRVGIENRTGARAENVTLQVVVPASVLVDTVEGDPGLVSRSGPLVRWYLPGLDPGATEVLRLSGIVARAPAEGVDVCALLLSGGSPVELCGVIPSAAGAEAVAPTPTPTGQAGAGAGVEAGAGADLAADSTREALDRGALGLGILLLGLGVLGVALGLRRPARAPRPDGE